RLDLDLLTEEVQQLRDQVEVALRKKLRVHRRNSVQANEGAGVPPEAMNDAQTAYEAARAAYLARARFLRSEQRRLATAPERRRDGREQSGGSTPPSDDGLEDRGAGKSGPHPSAAAIGSIDMDVVMKRYEKIRESEDRLNSDMNVERKRLAKLGDQAQKLA